MSVVNVLTNMVDIKDLDVHMKFITRLEYFPHLKFVIIFECFRRLRANPEVNFINLIFRKAQM
jgi:hypothetical protein